jgi:hypothetical protein
MKTNTNKIEEWLAINAPGSREALCYKTGIGFYTLKRILKGDKQATRAEMAIIAKVTGMNLEELIIEDTQSIA